MKNLTRDPPGIRLIATKQGTIPSVPHSSVGNRMISMMRHPARPPHVALADHFADPGSSRHPLRIRLTSGEEFDCRAPCFDVDHLALSVTTSEGAVRKILPAHIQVLYERRPRCPAIPGHCVTTVSPRAGASAVIAAP